MSKVIKLCLVLMLSMTCEKVETPRFYPTLFRCENDEVVCYIFDGYKAGGLSCKFKTGV